MRIAVLSGKGGTGKTLTSVNLAAAAGKAVYYDCDVEEPNGALFFKPEGVTGEAVTVPLPQVDAALCNGCRACVGFCNFNAMAYVGGRVKLFEDICHACGGCVIVCPQNAISERPKKVGEVQRGMSEEVGVHSGILKMGEPSGTPIIKRLLDTMDGGADALEIVDCPPGSACIVMDSIKDADYCLLVAEPTTFGAHNLAMVHELVQVFGKPHGALLNKCHGEVNPAEDYCLDNGVSILGRIPYDADLGKLNAEGRIAVREDDKWKVFFEDLIDRIEKEVGHATATHFLAAREEQERRR